MFETVPWLVAMTALMGCSAFFSASEAALFSLRGNDRRNLAEGTRPQRIAAHLLEHPDQLLSAVLFWNLVFNIAYFAMAAIVERHVNTGSSAIWLFRSSSLLLLIFFGEMLPKSLGVSIAPRLAALVSIPLTACVRVIDPFMPLLRVINLLSQRMIWPRFKPESYLEVADLERAIELSTSDAQLLDQEQTVLRNIVAFSELRVAESMRPRNQLRTFRPPVSVAALKGEMTPSGYLFVTEADGDEITAAIRLQSLSDFSAPHLERYAQPVIYVPWCVTVADTLQRLSANDREAAVVVNELGETIGVLTLDDILDAVFMERSGRSERLLNREAIQMIRPGLWQVTGLTNLRRLSDYFAADLPPTHSATVSGVVQECLQRLPRPGDECQWGPLHLNVVEASDNGQILVHISRVAAEDSP